VKNRSVRARSPYRAKKELNGRVFGSGAKRICLDKHSQAHFLLHNYLNQYQLDRIWPDVKAALKGHNLGEDGSERRQEILRLSNLGSPSGRIEKIGKLIRNLVWEIERPLRMNTYGDLLELESEINWLQHTLDPVEPVIRYIIEENDDPSAERKLADFISRLKTARKLRQANNGSGVATNRNHRFLSATLRLTEHLQRPPLLKEIRQQLLSEGLAIGADEIGRLARNNGLSWLKPGPRGRSTLSKN
jgi:hypothetical protein